jgi:hypothetical protein
MYTLSLTTAHYLRNSLDGAIGEIESGLRQNIPLEVISNLSVEDYEKVMEEKSKSEQASISELYIARDFLFQLRQLIAEANFHSGITALLNEREKLDRELKFLEFYISQLKRNLLVAVHVKFLLAQQEFNKTQEEKERPSQVFLRDWIEPHIAALEKAVRGTRLERKRIEEKRGSINGNTTISLPDEMVSFLKEKELL